jgi:hypothetical protein
MKKSIQILSLLACILAVSCKNNPQEVCNCLKKAANEYIINGVKPSKNDLKESCKDLLESVKDKAEFRAPVESCGDEILELVATKRFSSIDGEEMPQYPTYTYENLKDFMTELYPNNEDYENSKSLYKVYRSNIIIKNVYLGKRLEGSYATNNGNFRKVYDLDSYSDYAYFIHNLKKLETPIQKHFYISAFNQEFIDYQDYTRKPELYLIIPEQIDLKNINSSIENPSLSLEGYLDGVVVKFNQAEISKMFNQKSGLFCLTKADIIGHYYGGEGRGTKSIFVVDSIINIVKQAYPTSTSSNNVKPEPDVEGMMAAPSETKNTSSTSSNIVYYRIEDPDGYTNLRDKPNGTIIKKVLSSEKFEVIGQEQKHKKVKLSDGTIGFIHESRVKQVN